MIITIFDRQIYREFAFGGILQLRLIHCAMVSPFILPCLPFSLTGERKGEKSLKRFDELYGFYLLRHDRRKCVQVIASSVKIITKRLASALLLCTDSSQPGWFHVETYMRACSWAVICQYSWCYQASRYDDRLEDRFIIRHVPIHVTDYEIICGKV